MDVAKVLKENNIAPKKELDQFFLADEEMLNCEVKLAKLKPDDRVLEIGAGIGNLTEKIAAKSKVIAIEKDYSFRNMLKNVKNANVIFGDALEILESLRKAAEARPAAFNKIISNIPYSITQDLIVELLRHKWDSAVLCVQKEFAQKLKQKEKIALAVNDCCDVKILDNVPADAFYPKAVDSSIILLKQKKTLDYGFWEFLNDVYKDKNKDVKNAVKDFPVRLAKKKLHQLTAEELKRLYELNNARVV